MGRLSLLSLVDLNCRHATKSERTTARFWDELLLPCRELHPDGGEAQPGLAEKREATPFLTRN